MAGIVLPAAKPVGSFTKAQVALAYQWSSKLLVAADLDPQTLAGGTPTAFEKLLTNNERTWFTDNLNKKGVNKNGVALSSRGMVVSFPSGSTKLIGNAIKVHGTMNAKAVTDDGSPVLAINVDYDFVYAAEPPGHPELWMRLVEEQSWSVWFGNWQDAATSFEPSVTSTGNGGMAGGTCGTTDGYVHPDWPNISVVPNPSDSASGKPVNPYVAGQARSVAGCESTTGT